jgi:hypothetical protein
MSHTRRCCQAVRAHITLCVRCGVFIGRAACRTNVTGPLKFMK